MHEVDDMRSDEKTEPRIMKVTPRLNIQKHFRLEMERHVPSTYLATPEEKSRLLVD